MRIAVGSDHAGFDLKSLVAGHLADAGHQVTDLGTDRPDVSVDYPVFGSAVGRAVAEGRVDRGVCVCGTGIGISMAANKVPGVRAALVHDVTTASLARRHNDANVVCLGGRTLGSAEALDAVDTFFSTEYEGGHHQPRVDELAALDAHPAGDPAAAALALAPDPAPADPAPDPDPTTDPALIPTPNP